MVFLRIHLFKRDGSTITVIQDNRSVGHACSRCLLLGIYTSCTPFLFDQVPHLTSVILNHEHYYKEVVSKAVVDMLGQPFL